MRTTLANAIAAALVAGASVSTTHAEGVEHGLVLRTDGAVNTANDSAPSMQKAEASAQWSMTIPLGAQWRTVAQLRVRADTQDQLEPGKPDQQERSGYNRRWLIGDHADAELRELYVDGAAGPLALRIGKQQIAWGQADGLRVLDVVNPISYREFIWPKAEDRRIALWTLNAELSFDAGALQLLWLPDPTYDELPLDDETFAITSPKLVPNSPPGVPVRVAPTARPKGLLDSSDAGARLSLFAGGWDLTLNYLYHFYDDPVPFSAITPTGVVTTPRYERSQLIGGSASTAFGSTTLRTEVAHSTNRWFLTTDPRDADKVFASDELAFVAGLDNTALDNTLLSVQYFQSRMLDPAVGATRDRDEKQMTLLVQRSFANETVKLRTLWLTSLNDQDDAVQAQLSWQVTTSLTLAVSVEQFYGDRTGVFGEFRAASRAGVSFEWAP